MTCFELNWFFTIRFERGNFPNCNGRYVLKNSFLSIFSLKTQQIEAWLLAITIDNFSIVNTLFVQLVTWCRKALIFKL